MTARAKYEVVSDAEGAFSYLTRHFKLLRVEGSKGLVQLRDGEPIAACLYEGFNGHNIIMHCAGEPGRGWLTRQFLFNAFDYPFNQLKVTRITLLVESDNADCIRFVKHLGFGLEATLHGAAASGQDTLVFVMYKESCQHVRAELLRCGRRSRRGG